MHDILKSDYPFEEFLKQMHGEHYTGTDDDMPDAFEAWVTELDGDELIGYGNKFGKILINNLKK
jgi:hypothetical protein